MPTCCKVEPSAKYMVTLKKKNEDSTRKFPFFAQRSSTEGVPERAADSWPDGPAVSLGTQHTF